MHYTGTVWRPPYEASSLLLEVTAGCTHHRCKFCTLYHDLPFRFRMSPMEDIESDLLEAQLWSTDPIAMLSARLQGLQGPGKSLCPAFSEAESHCRADSPLFAVGRKYRMLCPCDGYLA